MITIRQVLQIDDAGTVAGGVVRIARATFGVLDPANSFSLLIDSTYHGVSISIAQARANPAGAPDAPVVITGQGDILNQRTLPVTATLSVVDGQVVAQIAYALPTDTAGRATWKFRDDLPDLPTVINFDDPTHPASPLDGLALRTPSYIAANVAQTVDGVALAPGLNVRATMTPNGLLGAFTTIASSGPLALVGTVYVPRTDAAIVALVPGEMPWELEVAPPGVTLSAPLFAQPVKLGNTATFSDAEFRLYSPPSNSWRVMNPTFAPLSGVSTTLLLPALSVTVDVTALTAAGTDGATIIATFPNHSLGSLGDLVDLIGAQDVAKQLPSALQAAAGGLGSLQLTRLAITVEAGKAGLTLTSAAATISAPDLRWQLGSLLVDGVALDVTVDSPFASPQLDVSVRGDLAFEGVPLVITAHLSQAWSITAQLASPQTLPLKQLMASYVPDIPAPSDLTIDNVALVVSPGKYVAISASMADQPNPWTIPLGPTGLVFSNVSFYLMVPSTGSVSGSFGASASIGQLELTGGYQIPGDFQLSARYPEVKLTELIGAITNTSLTLPGGFDLDFEDSYVLIEKHGNNYQLSLGTTIAQFGSLAFVVKDTGGQWGFAAGVMISKASIGQLQGVGSFVEAFDDWFPFDQLVLAISTISDSTFTFPGFSQFRTPALGTSKITLPAVANGVSRGFYLYTTTVFTRKNKILGALIDLMKIPENTALTCMFAYLADKSAFQLGVSITTFVTPNADPAQRTCTGPAGYDNGCLTGALLVTVGGSDGFTFALVAALKTKIQGSPVDFTVIVAVEANGIFVSGTMDNQRPLAFGPLQLAGLAVELGISYEGIPSFGFACTLDVAGAFESSIAVLVDTSNPAKSMIAGALSDLTLRKIVDALVGGSDVLPPALDGVLEKIGIAGTSDGAFTIPAASAAPVVVALDGYDAATISAAFATYGQVQGLPSTSSGLTLFVDTPGKQWYLTAKTGTATNSLITHYEVSAGSDGSLAIAKEAQFYFVPDPAGSQIGAFFYPAGMMVAGRLTFLFFDLDVDIEIQTSRGIKIDASLAPIQLVSRTFFSITAASGDGGARVSICTYSQPSAPAAEQSPHFLVDGQLTILGVQRSVFASVDSSGMAIALSGDIIPVIVTGSLTGTFTGSTGLDIKGDLLVGLGAIDLGPFGTYHLDTGATASAHVYANSSSIGAAFAAGCELGGHTFDLGTISLDVSTEQLSDLAGKLLSAAEDVIRKAFEDVPKLFAELARKLLNWADSQISTVLGTLGLSSAEINAILGVLPALCAATTATDFL